MYTMVTENSQCSRTIHDLYYMYIVYLAIIFLKNKAQNSMKKQNKTRGSAIAMCQIQGECELNEK